MFDKKEYNKQWRQDHLEYAKQWRLGNKKERAKYQKQWRIDHKKEITEYIKQWRKDHPEYKKQHPEYFKKYSKQYRLDHPEYYKQYRKTPEGKATSQRGNTKRRVREGNIINTLTSQEWIDILKEYKFKCAYCGKEFTLFDRETKDHVIPISKGGDNTKENVVPACRSCNSKKGTKIYKKKLYPNIEEDFIKC